MSGELRDAPVVMCNDDFHEAVKQKADSFLKCK
jgi:hypothetical protein